MVGAVRKAMGRGGFACGVLRSEDGGGEELWHGGVRRHTF
jgi:hypothetical protein